MKRRIKSSFIKPVFFILSITIICIFFPSLTTSATANTTLPCQCDSHEASIDLFTNSLYFPSLKHQEPTSCSAWAATYYQFTYEISRKYNINASANTNSNAFSPNYVFNYLNLKYKDVSDSSISIEGLNLNDCYEFLKRQGSVNYQDFNITDVNAAAINNPNIKYPWYGAIGETSALTNIREALQYRISSYNYITNNNNSLNNFITDNHDTDLNEIKCLLNQGYALGITTPTKNAKVPNSPIVLCSYFECDQNNNAIPSYHCVLIVGYDDNFYYDINGNGMHESNEYGAFKIIDSFVSNDYANNNSQKPGRTYMMMYDSLNKVSSSTNVPSNTVREGSVRNNRYWYISVAQYTPKLTVDVNVKQDIREDLRISLGYSSSLGGSKTWNTTFVNNIGGPLAFNGSTNTSSAQDYTFVFDFEAYDFDLKNGYYWVKVENLNSSGVNDPFDVNSVTGNAVVGNNQSKTTTYTKHSSSNADTYVYYTEVLQYENTQQSAVIINENTSYNGSINTANDEQWFAFTYTGSNTQRYLTYVESSANITFSIYENNQLLGSSSSGISIPFTQNQKYYIKVSGAVGDYSLRVVKGDVRSVSVVKYNPDARCVEINARAASFYNSIQLSIGNQTFVLTKGTGNVIEQTINGVRFRVDLTNYTTDFSTMWEIKADVSGISALVGSEKDVQVSFSSNSANSGNSTVEKVFPYKTRLVSGVNLSAGGNLQSFLATLAETGYSLEVHNGNDSTPITVTSSTRAATGMKIVKRNSGYVIVEVMHLIVFGDVQGDGQVTSLDSSIVLQYDADIGALEGAFLLAADVTKDNRVTSLDSAFILRYDAGLQEIDQTLVNTDVPDCLYFGSPVAF